jgi:RNA polymerase sigma factor (sigma-70 family)
MRDERLAERAAAGDSRAFAAIYQRYQEDLFRYCMAIVGNRADAQDALQNTMVKALRALPGEEREIKLKPWLYRVARNEAIEIVRGRRKSTPLDDLDSVVAGEAMAGSVETRERLRGLLGDLSRLPERQRSALVLRELSGLDYGEIGAALETSQAVARQTVYEARLGLHEMERGREMSCEEVKQAISTADGRVLRRRDLRAHLRGCEDCRSFREAIGERRHDLAAIAPLPAAASLAILQGVLSGSAGSAGGAAAAAGAGAGAGGAGVAGAGGAGAGAGVAGAGGLAGKALATSGLVKGLAALAVVAAGVATADRTGLVDTPLSGGHGSSGTTPAASSHETPGSLDSGSAGGGSGSSASGGGAGGSGGGAGNGAGSGHHGRPQSGGSSSQSGSGGSGDGSGANAETPSAQEAEAGGQGSNGSSPPRGAHNSRGPEHSQAGQHGNGQGSGPGSEHGSGNGGGNGGPSQGGGQGGGGTSQPAHPTHPSHPAQPAHPSPPPQSQSGQPTEPAHPETPSQGAGAGSGEKHSPAG